LLASSGFTSTPLGPPAQRKETATQRKRREKEARLAVDWPGAQGMNPELLRIRFVHNTSTEWGWLYPALSKCGKVIQFLWKGSQLVLFMSTVHRGSEYIERERVRPAKGTAGHTSSLKAFGTERVKKQMIPCFIDDYNHHKNAVDLANQF
jgi:hypothetical protein